jgi:hypothetical protein
MITELTTAIAGLKAASELGTLMLKIKVDAAVTDKVIESQAAIFGAQSAMIELQSKHQELLEENSHLKQKLIEIENWDVEAQKYVLTEVGSRKGVVYALKPEHRDSAPLHYLCPECYQEKRKSILQNTGSISGRTGYFCSRCPTKVQM